jgi:hypothetical protein
MAIAPALGQTAAMDWPPELDRIHAEALALAAGHARAFLPHGSAGFGDRARLAVAGVASTAALTGLISHILAWRAAADGVAAAPRRFRPPVLPAAGLPAAATAHLLAVQRLLGRHAALASIAPRPVNGRP